MTKIKNKFIIFIILIIIWIIWFWIFSSFYNKNVDRDSYVILLNWKAVLNNNILSLDEKEKLSIWDTIRTIWEDALAILEWWDWSVTRLWWDTSIEINELFVSNDLWKLNISFELINWKTWSNVISFLWEDSYFKEYFRDSEAAVRWTIFNVDLDNDYLYVLDHKLNLKTDTWEVIVVDEQQPINLKTFSFIELAEFLNNFKDKAWENLNNNFDSAFFDTLKSRANEDLNNLINLRNIDINWVINDSEAREELYNELLTEYQKINFIKVDDGELFEAKLEIKEQLVKLANAREKAILLENTLYDFKDIIDSKDYSELDKILPILSDNKDLLDSLNLKNHINLDSIPDDLKESFWENFNQLKDMFWGSLIDVKSLDIDVKSIEEKASQALKDGLDSLFNK